jgi:hypothetical protein
VVESRDQYRRIYQHLRRYYGRRWGPFSY